MVDGKMKSNVSCESACTQHDGARISVHELCSHASYFRVRYAVIR